MADRPERGSDKGGEEGREGSREGGREGGLQGGRQGECEGIPPQQQHTITVQHPPQIQSASHGRRFDRADPAAQVFPLNLGSMSAALPDARYAGYHSNPIQGQARLVTGEGPSSQNQHSAPAQSPPLQPSQGMASQFFGQFPQQGRQMEGFHMNYTSSSFVYGYPQIFAHSYPQALPHQQPMAYGPVNPGYYHVQPHFASQNHDNRPGIVLSQNHSYFAPPQALGTTNRHGTGAAGRAGSALPKTGSTSVSRHSSVSSATSSTLRGPPRKPKQSGYAMWCGNLPAQTNIVELKDHFSRDATNDIESVFLISKSNCAFINYKTEESCAAALARFHDSRFHGAKLVCRLRRGSTASPAGGPTASRTDMTSSAPNQSSRGISDRRNQSAAQDDHELQGMGPKAREKFFVLKSLTVEDLDASVGNGSWATQSHNEAALNTAYQSAENVYLVFSANKSGEYYGYARMVSSIDDTVGAAATAQARPTPSPTIVGEPWITVPTPATEHAPRGHVVNESARGTIFWEAEPEQIRETRETEDETAATEKAEPEIDQRSLGRPFKIQWLSTEKLPFHQTRGLRNPWNQNRDVKIARDGTEIEPSVGRRLVNLFHSNQVAAAPPAGPQLLQRIGHPSMPSTAYTPDPRFRPPY